MKYYKNCDELPIYNFHEILKNNDLNFLVVGYEQSDEIELDDKASGLWSEIYEEYIDLTGDNTLKVYYEVLQDLMFLKTRYSVVSGLLVNVSTMQLTEDIFTKYISELRSWGYKINVNKPLANEINRKVRQLRASENKIRIKENELESLRSKRDHGDNMTLITQSVKMEQALSRNNIDIKTTVVSKWVAMIKEIKEINEANRKRNGK